MLFQNCCLLTTSLCCPMSMTSCKSLNSLRVYAHRKSLTVNTHKSEVMCFKSGSDNRLPPLYYDGTQLSYTDTFKYLGMVCDKNINLTTAADAALRPFTAGNFRVKRFVQENVLTNRLHAHLWLPENCAIPASMYASQIWSTPFLKQGKQMNNPLQKWLLTVKKNPWGHQGHYSFLVRYVRVWPC